MVTYGTPSSPRSFGSALKTLLRLLFRLVLVLIAGGILGAAIYYGLLTLYRQTINPLRTHTVRLNAIETRQAFNQQQIDDRMAQFNQRLTDLESRRALDLESLSALDAELTRFEATLRAQSTALIHLDQIESGLSEVGATTALQGTLAANLQATLESSDSPLARLQRELQVLRALELLNRSRLFMAQGNYGMATRDLEIAREILLMLEAEAPADQKATVVSWRQRLELAIANLPAAPVLAADDLEIAWRLLMEGLPPPATPTPTPTETATLSPSPSPTLTPTLPPPGTATPKP